MRYIKQRNQITLYADTISDTMVLRTSFPKNTTPGHVTVLRQPKGTDNPDWIMAKTLIQLTSAKEQEYE